MEHFITKIEIKEVRHLKDVTIELSDTEMKHLILTGKNGSGKTSVLEAMRDNLDNNTSSEYLKLSPIYENASNINELQNELNRLNILHYKGEISLIEYENKKNAIDNRIRFLQISNYKIESSVNIALNNFDETLECIGKGSFILSYFGVKRTLLINDVKGPVKFQLNENYPIIETINQNFLQYMVNLKFQEVLGKNNGNNDKLNEAKKIEDWFNKFELTLKFLFDDENLKFVFDSENYNFNIVTEGHNPFDLNTLADGYSSIIDIVSELIMRMENKHSYDVEGIVLIDEIETHLHVDLQKKILPFLTGFFPKVQFIVSTHSPFVLQTAKNAVIYDLENNVRAEDFSQYSYNGIVEGYFEVDEYSEEIKKKLSRYEGLALRSDLSEEEEDEMLDLQDYLSNIPPFLAPEPSLRFNQIELERSKEKVHGEY